jgi:uncharacterized protein
LILDNIKEIKKEVLNLLDNKLDLKLHFHSLEHTRLVYLNVKEISAGMNLTEKDTYLTKIAALFHDTGFLKAYAGHEAESCIIARDTLPHFGLKEDEISKICGMIMATKIPQSPKTLLENILCDADLMYLGTDRFREIGDLLHLELNEIFGVLSQEEWDKIQIKFLQNHQYHTRYCIEKYGPTKLQNLEKLIARYT